MESIRGNPSPPRASRRTVAQHLHDLRVPREDMDEDDAACVIQRCARRRVCGARWKCLVQKHPKTWVEDGQGGRRWGRHHRDGSAAYAVDKMLQEPDIIGLTYNTKCRSSYFIESSFAGMNRTNTFNEANPIPPEQTRSRKYTWHVVYMKK